MFKRLSIDCVILAAGESARMGRWKLFLRFADSTVIETTIANAAAACDRIILVAGHRADELEERIAASCETGRLSHTSSGVRSATHRVGDDLKRRVEIVRNPAYSTGVYSSLKTGAELVRSGSFFLALADMPWVEPRWYRAVTGAASAAANSAAGGTANGTASDAATALPVIVRPFFGSVPGHPVLFSAVAREWMLDSRRTMDEIFSASCTITVPADDDGVIRDIDIPDDLEAGGGNRTSALREVNGDVPE